MTDDGETQTCPQVEVLRGRDGRDGRDGGKGEKGDEGSKGEGGEAGTRGLPGDQGEGPQGLLEYLVPGGQWGRRAVLGPQVCLGLKGNMVHRDQQQEEGQSTLAGGGPPVP